MHLQLVSVICVALVGVNGFPRPSAFQTGKRVPGQEYQTGNSLGSSGVGQLSGSGFNSAGQQHGGFNQFSGSHGSGVGGAVHSEVNGGFSGGFQTFQSGGGASGSFGSSGSVGADIGGGLNLGVNEIEKTIYTFVAPDMPAGPPIVIGGSNGGFKKRYNVIFVKTPSMPAPEIILPQLNGGLQEKNLIYVLQELPRRPVVPSLDIGTPSAPLKPEVFLIKYDAAGNTFVAEGGQSGSTQGLFSQISGSGGFGGAGGAAGSSGFGGAGGAAGSSGFGGAGGAAGSGGFGGAGGAAGSSGFGGASGSSGFGGASGSSGFGGASGSSGFGVAGGAAGSSGFGGAGGVDGSSGFGDASGSSGSSSGTISSSHSSFLSTGDASGSFQGGALQPIGADGCLGGHCGGSQGGASGAHQVIGADGCLGGHCGGSQGGASGALQPIGADGCLGGHCGGSQGGASGAHQVIGADGCLGGHCGGSQGGASGAHQVIGADGCLGGHCGGGSAGESGSLSIQQTSGSGGCGGAGGCHYGVTDEDQKASDDASDAESLISGIDSAISSSSHDTEANEIEHTDGEVSASKDEDKPTA